MARDINARLSQLNTRRKSLDRINRLDAQTAKDVLAKGLLQESWEKRASTQPYTRYALGAMQAVDADDTRLHLESAEKVGKQLQAGLTMPVTFEIQGSVALDVHIRRVSDIDLLTLDNTFLTYDLSGGRSAGYNSSPLTSLSVLIKLRGESETLLRNKYPAANVDCSGGKCIALSGGTLARPVDVVPSHWYDTTAYQDSLQKHDRGVIILNKKVPETIQNFPFLHIKRVSDRDALVFSGLRKAIRLTKNVKNDAENQSMADGLPSFDIAALLYHADETRLKAGYINELYILSEVRRFLDWCWGNREQAKLLRTPDGTRYVLDSEKKWSALLTISTEMDDLAKRVAHEQNMLLNVDNCTWQQVDSVLGSARIPA